MTAPITSTPPATTPLSTTSSTAGGTSTTSGTGSSSSNSNPLAGLNPGGTLGQNAFMQLLVAQMTHQDPLSPSDSTAMASELAQFSQLEQLTNINTTLQGQGTANTNLTTAVNNSAALNLIGKTVTAQSSQVAVGSNPTTSVSTTVPSTGGDLVLQLLDSSGTVVETKDLGSVSSGAQSVQLSGVTQGLSNGVYTAQFSLTDSKGNVTHPTTSITAKVDGVSFSSTGATVTSGPLTIPIGSIASVTTQ